MTAGKTSPELNERGEVCSPKDPLEGIFWRGNIWSRYSQLPFPPGTGSEGNVWVRVQQINPLNPRTTLQGLGTAVSTRRFPGISRKAPVMPRSHPPGLCRDEWLIMNDAGFSASQSQSEPLLLILSGKGGQDFFFLLFSCQAPTCSIFFAPHP